MKVVIERFEDEFAIVETDTGMTGRISREALPEMANEGDVLDITLDIEETRKRFADISGKTFAMWE